MGCLSKLILWFIDKNNNRVHPIDQNQIDESIYQYTEEYDTIPTNVRYEDAHLRNRRRENSSNRANRESYSDLPIDEIINIINVTENNNRSDDSSQTEIVNKRPKKKKINKTCPICLEKINCEEKSDKTICKNKQCRACYHKKCINEWAKTKGTNDISCLLCTLKTIKVKATLERGTNRNNVIRSSVGYYNSQGYNYNSRYQSIDQNRYNSNYRINYSIYNSYRPPNTR